MSFLKQIDAVATPFAEIAAAGLRLLTARQHNEQKTLILRPGGMGDLILCQLALEELGIDPISVTWLIEKRSTPWADDQRLKYVCYDHNTLEAFRSVIGKFTLVINTEQLFGLSQAVAQVCRSKGSKLFSYSTNRGSGGEKIPYDWKDEHELDSFTRLFSAAFSIPKKTVSLVKKRKKVSSHLPIVAIAGLQSESRTLSLDLFSAIVASWSNGNKFEIVASPTDRAYAEALRDRFPDIAELTFSGFSDLVKNIALSERILSVDGGMVHIASYFGVPVTAIFTSGRDKKWAPLGEGSELVYWEDLECRPCTKFGQVPPCPYNFRCKEINFNMRKKLS